MWMVHLEQNATKQAVYPNSVQKFLLRIKKVTNQLTWLTYVVNEINLVHNLILVYFINFIYNLYILYSWLSGMRPTYQTVSYTE